MTRFRSLSFKISLVFVLVALLPLTAGMGYSIIVSWQALNTGIEQEIVLLGEKSTEFIEEWFTQRMKELKAIADYPEARSRDIERLEPILAAAEANFAFYENILLVDANGKGLAASNTGTDVATFDVSDRTWFHEVKRGTDTFSEPLLSRATGNLVVTVAAPIMTNGVFQGTIRGAVQLDTLFELVASQKVGYGGQSYLVDKSGTPVTEVNGLKNATGSPLKTEGVQQVIRNQAGFSSYEGPLGEEVYGYYTFLPLAGLGLIIEVPVKEASLVTRNLVTQSIIFAVIMAVLALIFGLLFARYLIVPIRKIVTVLAKFSSGDLAGATSIDRKDEIGEIQESIKTMQTQWQSVLQTMSALVTETMTSGEHLAAASEQNSAAIEEIASSASSFAQTVSQVKERTGEMTEQSNQTSATALNGQKQMTMAIGAFEGIVTSSKESMGALARVAEQAKEIQGVVLLVSSIAEQTNLLALNAAIEAARAGEQGRGFAVVADEVRKLAEQSQESIQSIVAIVNNLQQELQQGVQLISSTDQTVGEAKTVFHETDTIFQDIMDKVRETERLVLEVSENTNSLDLASQEISATTQQQAASIEEVAATANTVSGVGQQLGDVMARFKF